MNNPTYQTEVDDEVREKEGTTSAEENKTKHVDAKNKAQMSYLRERSVWQDSRFPKHMSCLVISK